MKQILASANWYKQDLSSCSILPSYDETTNDIIQGPAVRKLYLVVSCFVMLIAIDDHCLGPLFP